MNIRAEICYVSQNIVQFNFPVLVEQLLNGPSEETKK